MWFMKVTTVSEIMVDFILLNKRRTWIVRQVNTDDAMSSLTERSEAACLMKILTNKFRPSQQSRIVPYLAVCLNGITVFFLLDTWAASMTVWRQEGMYPEFIVNIGSWSSWKNIHCFFSCLASFTVEHCGST